MRNSRSVAPWTPGLSDSDRSQWYDNRDPVIKMREHNMRVQAQSRQRLERIYEARQKQQEAVQVIPYKPSEISYPVMIRDFLNRFKKATCDFKILHFTLQLGRLKIELSRANGAIGNK